MFRKFFLLTFIIISNNLFANTKDTLYYLGTVKVSKKVSYKYAIRFFIDDNNNVSGYSLTDPGGKYETKTKIIGSYDSTANAISFFEKKILRSKVDTSRRDLCFMSAKLVFRKINGLEVLSGDFTGTNPKRNSNCGKGIIQLINTQKVQKIIEESNSINEGGKSTIVDGKKEEKNKVHKVESSKPFAFLFDESEVTISVYDNGIVDDDKISVIVNGKYVLKDYTLDSAKKVFAVKIPQKEQNIRINIVAMNEGTEPPNTTMAIIESASEKYLVEIRAKKNESRIIYLLKRK